MNFRKYKQQTVAAFARIWCAGNVLFFGRKERYRYARVLFGCWYGFLLAFIFWNYTLKSMGLPDSIADFVYALFVVTLGISYAFFVSVRCVCLLVCISLFGKAGRSVLKAIIFAIVISGPIHNLSLNGQEVVRVFTCSTKLTYNLSRTRFDLMTRPVYNALLGIKENSSQINESFKVVKTVLIPIAKEVSDENDDDHNTTTTIVNADGVQKRSDANTIRDRYIAKTKHRCQEQMLRGLRRCERAFETAFERCHEKLPMIVNTLLCWPVKLTVVCRAVDMFGGARDICDPSEEIDQDFGENYQELNGVVANFSDVQLNYTRLDQVDGFKKNADDTVRYINDEVEHKRTLLNGYLFIMQKVLTLLCFKMLKDAYTYRRQYLADIDFDNVYITNYFKRIDERRRVKRHHTLLPIKSIERTYMFEMTTRQRGPKEYWKFVGNFVKVLFEMLTATALILVDHLLCVGLQLVAKHGRIDYVQEGEHIVKISVNGTGIIARLVKRSIAGFILNEHIKVYATNEKCLPRPIILSGWYYVQIYGTYLFILLLIYHEVYVYRLRRCAMAYFYFSREKQRVLHLYNKCLKKRRGMFQLMSATVREQNCSSKGRPMHSKLCGKCPKLLRVLQIFGFFRRICIVCKEIEPKPFDQFYECKLPDCYAVYCRDCWSEMRHICVACERFYRPAPDAAKHYSDYTDYSDHYE